MKKQFVTYEIALALKELSFNEPCFGRWFIGDDSYKEAIFFNQDHNNKVISNSNITEGYSILAPLWQQVIDWILHKYNIWVVVDTSLIKFYEKNVLLPPKFQFIVEDLIDRDLINLLKYIKEIEIPEKP